MPVTDRKKVPSQVPSSGVKKCTREAALANRSKGANTDDSAVSGAAAAIAISNGCPLPGSQAAVAAKKAKAAARRELIKFVYTSRCIYTSCCINIYFKKNNNHSHNSPGPPSRLKFPTGSPPPLLPIITQFMSLLYLLGSHSLGYHKLIIAIHVNT